jgi:ankyrin repeat protein
LLAKGADVQARDRSGRMPIHWAAIGGHENCLRYLLEQDGVDVNSVSESGWTPLHGAASGNRVDIINVLLELGADPALEDKQGRTAADLAKANGYKPPKELKVDSGSGFLSCRCIIS